MYLFTGMLFLLATIFGCARITSAAPEDLSIGQLSETDPSLSAHVSGYHITLLNDIVYYACLHNVVHLYNILL